MNYYTLEEILKDTSDPRKQFLAMDYCYLKLL